MAPCGEVCSNFEESRVITVKKAPLCKGGSRGAGGGLFFLTTPPSAAADTSPCTGEASYLAPCGEGTAPPGHPA